VRIAISGYYGFGNAGDDAILRSILQSVRTVDPDADIVVVTYPGGRLDVVRRTSNADAVDGADLAEVDQAIASADVLVIGGGGLIQDYLPTDPADRFSHRHANLLFWTDLALIARSHAVPVMTWAVGIGPLTTSSGRDEAGLLLSMVDRLTVRDRQSAELARQLGYAEPEIVADPAFLLTPTGVFDQSDLDLPEGGARRVVVAARHWGDDSWAPILAVALDRLIAEEDADVIFLPFQHLGTGSASDTLMSTLVAARMTSRDRRAVLSTALTPEETAAVVAGADLVVAMRMHSVVFAALAGVPTVALAYDPKVRIVMARLGLEDQVLALDGLEATELVAMCKAARSADADVVHELREQASRPAATLAELGTRARREVDPLLRAAVTGAVRQGSESARLQRAWDDADAENLRQAYDTLAAEYQEFLDSRAVRAVRQLWTVRGLARRPRELIRRVMRSVGRRILPAGLRRRLESGSPSGEIRLSESELASVKQSAETELEHFVNAHRDGPGFVVVPPSIGWDVPLFQRPQQMALAFADLGYGVIYHLEPRHAHGKVGYHLERDRILVGYLPEPITDLLQRVPSPIYLSYVYNFDWHRHLDSPTTVYEHIDDLEVFEQVYKRTQLDEWHARALADADVVAASAVDLLNDVRGQRPDAVLVANGVDYEHFAGDSRPPDDLGLTDRLPVVGYYGALAEWFDYELLGHAARALPDHQFLLIGPDYDGTVHAHRTVIGLPNVHWIGPRPYADLPRYLSVFTVATIPFVVNEVTHAVSPLKLFEYMAGGKPVVTPALRECARYRVVQIAPDADAYVEEIRRGVALAADADHVEALRRTARANTWDARVRTLVEAVELSRASRNPQ
jgi:polysaccharide pyruvyl transferase CsaB